MLVFVCDRSSQRALHAQCSALAPLESTASCSHYLAPPTPSAPKHPHNNRNEHLPLATLSSLLKTNTTAELYSKLSGLIDYLGVSEPVSKLLPPMEQVPLRYIGLLDLYYCDLVKPAADLILDSVVPGCSSCSFEQHKAAVLCIAGVDGSAGRIAGLAVYSLHASLVAKMVGGKDAGLMDEKHCVRLGPAQPDITSCSLSQLCFDHLGYASTLGSVISKKHAAFAHLQAVVKAAVAQIVVGGRTGVVKAEYVEAVGKHTYRPKLGFKEHNVPLWVVSW